jgi:hypothetical protein
MSEPNVIVEEESEPVISVAEAKIKALRSKDKSVTPNFIIHSRRNEVCSSKRHQNVFEIKNGKLKQLCTNSIKVNIVQ